MPSVEDEWKEAAAAGAKERRKALVPKLVGGAAFAFVFAAIFAVGAYVGAREDARREALRQRGVETVVYARSRGSRRAIDSREEGLDGGLAMFILAFGGGLVAGGVGFFAAGGRLSSRYARGLQELSNR